MPAAVLHDNTRLPLTIAGEGPALLLPVGLNRASPELERQMQAEGLDPQPGVTLLHTLKEHFTVVAFNYEGHRLQHPAAQTMTPSRVAEDLLAVADIAGADTFAYYGQSWLGVAGIHLAALTSRITALAVGGYPPLRAPVEALYDLAVRAHKSAVARVHTSNPAESSTFGGLTTPSSNDDETPLLMRAAQARQFVTFFRQLKETDDATVLQDIHCPALCFVGSEDIVPGTNGAISMAAPISAHKRELEQAGWNVTVLDGLDQTEAMQPNIISSTMLPWLLQVHRTTSPHLLLPVSNLLQRSGL